MLSALMEQRPVHLDERDAKYNQRRMVAMEVGFGVTFSAATLNDKNIGRATTRHLIPPRIIAGAVRRRPAPSAGRIKNALANEPSLLHNFAALLFLVE